MIKFVEKWMAEVKENMTIKKDQTQDKWVKCEEGLPHTDRQVEIIVYGRPKGPMTLYHDVVSEPHYCFGRFNPHKGWDFEQYYGLVVCWKDINQDLKDILEDSRLTKRLGIKE